MKNSPIATELRNRRRLFAIARDKVSEESGLTRSTIAKWEEMCGPLIKIERWADALGCKLTLIEKGGFTGE